jgi:anti-sigma regulatory factor (Ser/Thr protein kinase)
MAAVDAELVSLPADARAAGLARRAVRERLRTWDLGDLLDIAVLLTSEVVTNVIVHTASAPSLGVAPHGRGVRVTVVDGSPTPPVLRRHSPAAPTGRGLQMLRDLADDWGWERLGAGKAVWFVLRGDQEEADGRVLQPAADETAAASPLGRYGGTDDGGAGLVTVELLGVPVRVLAAAREHHDGLLREFRLLAMSGTLSGPDAPARLVELTEALGVRYAAAASRPDRDFDQAVEQGLDTVDLVYRVPPRVADGGRRLEALMADADEFCRAGRLMTPARSPAVARFARWYVHQFADQVAGRPPARWDGPLDPD